MNEELSEEIIDSFNKKTFIKEWLSHKYKEKSLALYGLPGTGKTTVADYILKDWVKVYIKSDFCKSSKNDLERSSYPPIIHTFPLIIIET